MKNFKKKITAIMLVVLTLCVTLLSGCANSGVQSSGNKKYSIVCTIFPEYDWIKNVLGDKAEDFDVTLLLKSGTDLHSYQPSAADIAKISRCDMFVYIGGESDSWVEDTHEEDSHDATESVHSNTTQEEDTHDDHDHEEVAYDEHIWLSLNNAKRLVSGIADTVSAVDEANANVYKANGNAYIDKLSELDNKYKEAVKSAAKNTVLFGDRFPFRYMTDDYGLEYYAAFTGCSAETEASFDTVTFLAKKLDELKLNTVLIIENSNDKLAKTIIQNSADKNQKILVINSLQSVTDKDIKNGVTYLSVMQDNLEILKQALD